MLSSQHHPAGRISQGPRVSGPEAILTQLPILIRASDGNKQARGISQGPGSMAPHSDSDLRKKDLV